MSSSPRLLCDFALLRHGQGEIVKRDTGLKTLKITKVTETGQTITYQREGDPVEYAYCVGDTAGQRETLARYHAALLTDPEAVQVLVDREARQQPHSKSHTKSHSAGGQRP